MSRLPRHRVWYQCNGLKEEAKCCLCDGIMIKKSLRGTRGEWHVEHVYPLSRGGPDIYPNLITICGKCNLSMKRGCESTFHHLHNKGHITKEVADYEFLQHKTYLESVDLQCERYTSHGERCLNHKCGKNEKMCYFHTKADLIKKIKQASN